MPLPSAPVSLPEVLPRLRRPHGKAAKAAKEKAQQAVRLSCATKEVSSSWGNLPDSLSVAQHHVLLLHDAQSIGSVVSGTTLSVG